MTFSEQHVQKGRYSLIPRTLTFILSDENVLLLEFSQNKGAWSGRFNGVGGHIEQGEHPLQAAAREVLEETGLLVTELFLCGLGIIDTGGAPGVALFIFVGQATGELQETSEGKPHWVPLNRLAELPLMEDLPLILPRSILVYRGEAPAFTALYQQSNDGQLQINLMPE